MRKTLLPILALLAFSFPGLSLPRWRTIDELRKLIDIQDLPSYREGIVTQVSSYDTTGGNEDGFAGKYSYLRKEKGKLVLADFKGPGVINRIWTPTPTKDTLEFYFDGERRPRLKVCFEDLFSGKVRPFVYPLCANEVGGYYCYFPFTFRKSCKIVLAGKHIQFHQIQCRSLEGYDVETFDGKDTAEITAVVDSVCALWSNLNPSMRDYARGKSAGPKCHEVQLSLSPGEEATLFSSDKGGRITGIELEAGHALETLYKDLIVKAIWDDDEDWAIHAPAADLFGYAYGRPAMRSILAGTVPGRSYLYLPAPYDSKARVSLHYGKRDDAPQAPLQIKARVFYDDIARDPGKEGRLYTCWRREIRPRDGKYYDFLKHAGRGHYVGTIHLAQGLVPKMTEFFEGDDSTYVDGAMRMHGTGSEDYYNGGWYALLDRWDRGASMPIHGCLDYSLQMSRTGAYRFFLSDKLSFGKEFYTGIEHGPSGNRFPVDYTSVAFFYSDTPSQEQMVPEPALRKVYIPDVHPYFPQLMNITMGPHVKTQFISSGIRCWAEDTGLVRVLLEDLPEGRYKVYVNYCEKTDGAEFSLWQRQQQISPWMSSMAPQYGWVDHVFLGEVDVTAQSNTLTFRFKGERYSREFEFAILYLEAVK